MSLMILGLGSTIPGLPWDGMCKGQWSVVMGGRGYSDGCSMDNWDPSDGCSMDNWNPITGE